MRYELSQKFYFEAAHTLDRAIDADASKRIHGHTYHAEITVERGSDPEHGMLIDLALVHREIARIRELLDHRFLDEVAGLGPATLENLCRYIFTQLADMLPGLSKVAVERQASGDRCCLTR